MKDLLYRRGFLMAIVATAIVLVLVVLPLAVVKTNNLVSENLLRNIAEKVSLTVTETRNYYTKYVVDQIVAHHGNVVPTHDRGAFENAVPIPATLSIEIGEKLRSMENDVHYEIFSDFPFANRERPILKESETDALAALRADPKRIVDSHEMRDGVLIYRLMAPIVMEQACVTCHNTHELSTKTDWQVGDVRAIQAITIEYPNTIDHSSLTPTLAAVAAIILVFSVLATAVVRQNRRIALAHGELEVARDELNDKNQFLENVQENLGKYMSPNIGKQILSGELIAKPETSRKRLTIFFSDLVNFTSTTERLQSEVLTDVLNEYLTEMTAIAVKHGGTIDKYIGDAIMIFFGDPVTRGEAVDADACVQMAIEMQAKLAECNTRWLAKGYDCQFQTRMGISTGYCNVGNFGSDHRVDYTIIGAPVNLAARLEQVCAPGEITMSEETYQLVKHRYPAKQGTPIHVKGIGGEITPYSLTDVPSFADQTSRFFSIDRPGFRLFVDMDSVAEEDVEHLNALRSRSSRGKKQDNA